MSCTRHKSTAFLTARQTNPKVVESFMQKRCIVNPAGRRKNSCRQERPFLDSQVTCLRRHVYHLSRGWGMAVRVRCKLSPEFWVFIRILVFHPITEVSPEYWAFTRILGFHPILPTVGNIFHLRYVYWLTQIWVPCLPIEGLRILSAG